jgi:hypothetical protein
VEKQAVSSLVALYMGKHHIQGKDTGEFMTENFPRSLGIKAELKTIFSHPTDCKEYFGIFSYRPPYMGV